MTPSQFDADELSNLEAENRALEIAMREAVNEAVLLHKRLGLPMVEWLDGEIVWTPADQLTVNEPDADR